MGGDCNSNSGRRALTLTTGQLPSLGVVKQGREWIDRGPSPPAPVRGMDAVPGMEPWPPAPVAVARYAGCQVITIDVRRTEAAAQSDEVLLMTNSMLAVGKTRNGGVPEIIEHCVNPLWHCQVATLECHPPNF